ncbi:MAG TPA: riboflavin synthase [Burkholderiales bacterium]|nr:riboflavin synthase [Burkholderiales bacterium]
MFTGIVAAVGRIAGMQPATAGARVEIDAGALALDDVAVGDSIAVNGVCLTVVSRTAKTFCVDVSGETLSCTVGYAPGDAVNLEKALRLADRLGGHIVTGHVDGVGSVVTIVPAGENRIVTIAVPPELSRYVARKGSIAVNGVSLTVNDVEADRFTVNLIPHTLAATTLHAIEAGARVNLEVDMMARYIERMLEQSREA